MMQDGRFQAILLPGGVMPAELAYPDLVRALGTEVDARFKEHELYASSEPPADWGLETEVEAVRSFADEAASNSSTSSGTRAAARSRSRSAPLIPGDWQASLSASPPGRVTRTCRRTSESSGTNSSGSRRCRRSK
jgi:hypothetical protein